MKCISNETLKDCACTYLACDKRGNCCKCVSFHRNKGEIPGCFFSQKGERTYDRSIAHFCKDRGF